MPTVSLGEQSVAANTKTTEQLAGTPIQNAPFAGLLQLIGKASAVDMRHTLTIGSEVVLDDDEINVLKAAGTGLDRDADLLYRGQVLAGEQIRYFYRNASAGAITVASMFILE